MRLLGCVVLTAVLCLSSVPQTASWFFNAPKFFSQPGIGNEVDGASGWLPKGILNKFQKSESSSSIDADIPEPSFEAKGLPGNNGFRQDVSLFQNPFSTKHTSSKTLDLGDGNFSKHNSKSSTAFSHSPSGGKTVSSHVSSSHSFEGPSNGNQKHQFETVESSSTSDGDIDLFEGNDPFNDVGLPSSKSFKSSISHSSRSFSEPKPWNDVDFPESHKINEHLLNLHSSLPKNSESFGPSITPNINVGSPKSQSHKPFNVQSIESDDLPVKVHQHKSEILHPIVTGNSVAPSSWRFSSIFPSFPPKVESKVSSQAHSSISSPFANSKIPDLTLKSPNFSFGKMRSPKLDLRVERKSEDLTDSSLPQASGFTEILLKSPDIQSPISFTHAYPSKSSSLSSITKNSGDTDTPRDKQSSFQMSVNSIPGLHSFKDNSGIQIPSMPKIPSWSSVSPTSHKETIDSIVNKFQSPFKFSHSLPSKFSSSSSITKNSVNPETPTDKQSTFETSDNSIPRLNSFKHNSIFQNPSLPKIPSWSSVSPTSHKETINSIVNKFQSPFKFSHTFPSKSSSSSSITKNSVNPETPTDKQSTFETSVNSIPRLNAFEYNSGIQIHSMPKMHRGSSVAPMTDGKTVKKFQSPFKFSHTFPSKFPSSSSMTKNSVNPETPTDKQSTFETSVNSIPRLNAFEYKSGIQIPSLPKIQRWSLVAPKSNDKTVNKLQSPFAFSQTFPSKFTISSSITKNSGNPETPTDKQSTFETSVNSIPRLNTFEHSSGIQIPSLPKIQSRSSVSPKTDEKTVNKFQSPFKFSHNLPSTISSSSLITKNSDNPETPTDKQSTFETSVNSIPGQNSFKHSSGIQSPSLRKIPSWSSVSPTSHKETINSIVNKFQSPFKFSHSLPSKFSSSSLTTNNSGNPETPTDKQSTFETSVNSIPKLNLFEYNSGIKIPSLPKMHCGSSTSPKTDEKTVNKFQSPFKFSSSSSITENAGNPETPTQKQSTFETPINSIPGENKFEHNNGVQSPSMSKIPSWSSDVPKPNEVKFNSIGNKFKSPFKFSHTFPTKFSTWSSITGTPKGSETPTIKPFTYQSSVSTIRHPNSLLPQGRVLSYSFPHSHSWSFNYPKFHKISFNDKAHNFQFPYSLSQTFSPRFSSSSSINGNPEFPTNKKTKPPSSMYSLNAIPGTATLASESAAQSSPLVHINGQSANSPPTLKDKSNLKYQNSRSPNSRMSPKLVTSSSSVTNNPGIPLTRSSTLPFAIAVNDIPGKSTIISKVGDQLPLTTQIKGVSQNFPTTQTSRNLTPEPMLSIMNPTHSSGTSLATKIHGNPLNTHLPAKNFVNGSPRPNILQSGDIKSTLRKGLSPSSPVLINTKIQDAQWPNSVLNPTNVLSHSTVTNIPGTPQLQQSMKFYTISPSGFPKRSSIISEAGVQSQSTYPNNGLPSNSPSTQAGISLNNQYKLAPNSIMNPTHVKHSSSTTNIPGIPQNTQSISMTSVNGIPGIRTTSEGGIKSPTMIQNIGSPPNSPTTQKSEINLEISDANSPHLLIKPTHVSSSSSISNNPGAPLTQTSAVNGITGTSTTSGSGILSPTIFRNNGLPSHPTNTLRRISLNNQDRLSPNSNKNPTHASSFSVTNIPGIPQNQLNSQTYSVTSVNGFPETSALPFGGGIQSTSIIQNNGSPPNSPTIQQSELNLNKPNAGLPTLKVNPAQALNSFSVTNNPGTPLTQTSSQSSTIDVNLTSGAAIQLPTIIENNSSPRNSPSIQKGELNSNTPDAQSSTVIVNPVQVTSSSSVTNIPGTPQSSIIAVNDIPGTSTFGGGIPSTSIIQNNGSPPNSPTIQKSELNSNTPGAQLPAVIVNPVQVTSSSSVTNNPGTPQSSIIAVNDIPGTSTTFGGDIPSTSIIQNNGSPPNSPTIQKSELNSNTPDAQSSTVIVNPVQVTSSSSVTTNPRTPQSSIIAVNGIPGTSTTFGGGILSPLNQNNGILPNSPTTEINLKTPDAQSPNLAPLTQASTKSSAVALNGVPEKSIIISEVSNQSPITTQINSISPNSGTTLKGIHLSIQDRPSLNTIINPTHISRASSITNIPGMPQDQVNTQSSSERSVNGNPWQIEMPQKSNITQLNTQDLVSPKSILHPTHTTNKQVSSINSVNDIPGTITLSRENGNQPSSIQIENLSPNSPAMEIDTINRIGNGQAPNLNLNPTQLSSSYSVISDYVPPKSPLNTQHSSFTPGSMTGTNTIPSAVSIKSQSSIQANAFSPSSPTTQTMAVNSKTQDVQSPISVSLSHPAQISTTNIHVPQTQINTHSFPPSSPSSIGTGIEGFSQSPSPTKTMALSPNSPTTQTVTVNSKVQSPNSILHPSHISTTNIPLASITQINTLPPSITSPNGLPGTKMPPIDGSIQPQSSNQVNGLSPNSPTTKIIIDNSKTQDVHPSIAVPIGHSSQTLSSITINTPMGPQPTGTSILQADSAIQSPTIIKKTDLPPNPSGTQQSQSQNAQPPISVPHNNPSQVISSSYSNVPVIPQSAALTSSNGIPGSITLNNQGNITPPSSLQNKSVITNTPTTVKVGSPIPLSQALPSTVSSSSSMSGDSGASGISTQSSVKSISSSGLPSITVGGTTVNKPESSLNPVSHVITTNNSLISPLSTVTINESSSPQSAISQLPNGNSTSVSNTATTSPRKYTRYFVIRGIPYAYTTNTQTLPSGKTSSTLNLKNITNALTVLNKTEEVGRSSTNLPKSLMQNVHGLFGRSSTDSANNLTQNIHVPVIRSSRFGRIKDSKRFPSIVRTVSKPDASIIMPSSRSSGVLPAVNAVGSLAESAHSPGQLISRSSITPAQNNLNTIPIKLNGNSITSGNRESSTIPGKQISLLDSVSGIQSSGDIKAVQDMTFTKKETHEKVSEAEEKSVHNTSNVEEKVIDVGGISETNSNVYSRLRKKIISQTNVSKVIKRRRKTRKRKERMFKKKIIRQLVKVPIQDDSNIKSSSSVVVN